jgi:DNA-binding MarR family transcriptional regulator
MPESRLQHEIQQSRPFESPSQEAYLNLVRTQGALSAPFAALFRKSGLSEPTYNVLRILRGAGEPIPSREIGRRLVTRVPDVTRLVDRLEAAQLVRRERSTADRRVVHVSLTAKGRRLLGRLDEPVRRLSKESFAALSAAEIRELIRLLEKSRDAADVAAANGEGDR